MADKDPITLVYDALWEMAEAEQSLTEYIRRGNRVKLNTNDRNPVKPNVQDADLPELVLLPDGGNAQLYSTSSSSTLTKNFQWVVTTGDIRAVERLFPVQFAVFRAMADWAPTLTALTWNDKRFVSRTQLLDIQDGLSDPERNRGIMGWSSVWRCEVRMDFSTTDLKA